MGYRKIINNFTKGELDPRFLAMVDYDGYHKGCRKFRNVVGIPQGGSQRRFGTNYIDVVVDRNNANAPITDVSQVREIPFEFSGDEKFTVVIRPDSGTTGGQPHNIAFDVYQSKALVDTFFPPANTYTAGQIREFRWALGEDRIILFHNDVVFHQLIRNDFNNWVSKTTTLQFYPTYDYTGDDDLASPYTADGEVFTATALSGATITFSRSAGTSTPFTDHHVGGLIYTETAGVIRIETVNSNVSVTGYSLIDLDRLSNKGSEILITEKAWSNDSNVVVQADGRGWPGNGDFFQGRMVVGQWRSKEGRGSASVVNAAFNFDDWDADASTGYSFFTGSSGNDVIHDVIGYKSLVTIGFRGPSASSILVTEPTTPTSIFMNLQDETKASRVDATVINNTILYVGYNFETIYGMSFELPDTGYDVSNVSALSDHLITEVRWADAFNPSDRSGYYYCVVNEDGTMAVLLMLKEENIMSWSLNYTNGRIIDVACAGDEGHLLVKRKIGTGATVTGDPNYLYKVDKTFSVFTDVTTAISGGTPTTTLANTGDFIVIGSEIQFTRIDVGFNTVASADCELVFEYLDSTNQWSTFTPTDGTSGFTVAGEINFNYSDVNNWVQQELNDVPRMYWMRIKRSALGSIQRALTSDSNFTSFSYVDTQLNSASDDVELFTNDGDYLVIGQDTQYGVITVELDTVSSADLNPIFEYLDEDGVWQTFAPTDNTSGFTSNGTIEWTISALTGWSKGKVGSNSGYYWIRIQRNQPVVATPPIEDLIYFSVKTAPIVDALNVNTANRIYLEELDFDTFMDCQVNKTADGNGDVTGLTALAGQKCFVYSNGFPIGSYIVTSTGTLALGAANAGYNVQVGLDYKPLIVPMPVDAVLQEGHNTYHQQHIIEAYIDYYESLGVTCNGQLVVDEGQGSFLTAKAPVPRTDFWEVPVHRGWDPRQELEISQSYPAPMTILGIGLTVEIS